VCSQCGVAGHGPQVFRRAAQMMRQESGIHPHGAGVFAARRNGEPALLVRSSRPGHEDSEIIETEARAQGPIELSWRRYITDGFVKVPTLPVATPDLKIAMVHNGGFVNRPEVRERLIAGIDEDLRLSMGSRLNDSQIFTGLVITHIRRLVLEEGAPHPLYEHSQRALKKVRDLIKEVATVEATSEEVKRINGLEANARATGALYKDEQVIDWITGRPMLTPKLSGIVAVTYQADDDYVAGHIAGLREGRRLSLIFGGGGSDSSLPFDGTPVDWGVIARSTENWPGEEGDRIHSIPEGAVAGFVVGRDTVTLRRERPTRRRRVASHTTTASA